MRTDSRDVPAAAAANLASCFIDLVFFSMEFGLQDRAVGAHFGADDRVSDLFIENFCRTLALAAFNRSIAHNSPL